LVSSPQTPWLGFITAGNYFSSLPWTSLFFPLFLARIFLPPGFKLERLSVAPFSFPPSFFCSRSLPRPCCLFPVPAIKHITSQPRQTSCPLDLFPVAVSLFVLRWTSCFLLIPQFRFRHFLFPLEGSNFHHLFERWGWCLWAFFGFPLLFDLRFYFP